MMLFLLVLVVILLVGAATGASRLIDAHYQEFYGRYTWADHLEQG